MSNPTTSLPDAANAANIEQPNLPRPMTPIFMEKNNFTKKTYLIGEDPSLLNTRRIVLKKINKSSQKEKFLM